jgi:hypothetical protein
MNVMGSHTFVLHDELSPLRGRGVSNQIPLTSLQLRNYLNSIEEEIDAKFKKKRENNYDLK